MYRRGWAYGRTLLQDSWFAPWPRMAFDLSTAPGRRCLGRWRGAGRRAVGGSTAGPYGGTSCWHLGSRQSTAGTCRRTLCWLLGSRCTLTSAWPPASGTSLAASRRGVGNERGVHLVRRWLLTLTRHPARVPLVGGGGRVVEPEVVEQRGAVLKPDLAVGPCAGTSASCGSAAGPPRRALCWFLGSRWPLTSVWPPASGILLAGIGWCLEEEVEVWQDPVAGPCAGTWAAVGP